MGTSGLNSYSKIEDHYHIQGLPNRFAGQGTKVYNPRFKGRFPCFPNWPKDQEHIAEYVFISKCYLVYIKTIFILIG